VKVWIEKPVEPAKLVLVWQAPEGHPDRLRWAVGVIELEEVERFRYLTSDELFALNNGRTLDRLTAAGFAGYPAFSYEPGKMFDADILRTFQRRLPPPARQDFARYEEYFSIHPGSTISVPLLLALTEARLPSDGFSIIDPLDSAAEVCDAVFEIAGLRYEGATQSIEIGDELALRPDPTNTYDPDAVAVHWRGARIGFVNRLQAHAVAQWLSTRSVRCVVLRKNGRADAPRAYAKIAVRPRPHQLAA